MVASIIMNWVSGSNFRSPRLWEKNSEAKEKRIGQFPVCRWYNSKRELEIRVPSVRKRWENWKRGKLEERNNEDKEERLLFGTEENEWERNITSPPPPAEYEHMCSHCGKVCRSKAGLTIHAKHMHKRSDEKVMFNCDMCGQDFTQEANLVIHTMSSAEGL